MEQSITTFKSYSHYPGFPQDQKKKKKSSPVKDESIVKNFRKQSTMSESQQMQQIASELTTLGLIELHAEREYKIV